MEHNEIVYYEEFLRKAMLSGNVDVLNELIADDLLFVNQFGQIISKEADIEVHRSGNLKVTQIDILDQKIRQLEKSAVTVTKVFVSGTFKTESVAGEFYYTRVWKYREGKWQVVSCHCSSVT
ncbi:nuclear transport factor 2 family protein [Desulfocucumis palustris]|uniref:nuclear transport factor 2 family protein n=1 Tax=Desulfocucumis palustris TaxID=1898651 RepID=UPI000CE9BCCD|nr:nuclear transport factor 2 family protein [Desulfocucumis palustris]